MMDACTRGQNGSRAIRPTTHRHILWVCAACGDKVELTHPFTVQGPAVFHPDCHQLWIARALGLPQMPPPLKGPEPMP
jgi:hypothetical protein